MPKGPKEAIVELLSEELRAVILGLPRNLKDAVPERLKFDAGILAGAETCMDLDLEAVSKAKSYCCESIRTKNRCCQFVKGLEVCAASFIAQFQSSEVAEPAERTFDNIPSFAKATPVRPGFTQRGQKRFDAEPLDDRRQGLRSVTCVPLQRLRFGPRSTSGPADRWHAQEQWQSDLIIGTVGRRGLDDQRQSLGFGQDMALTACFCPIGRIGTGVRPPKTARTLALSMTARSKLIAAALPSIDSIAACSLDQTLSRVHSAKRRQQVLPLPQFISTGRACQGMPVLSTNRIPVRACRFDTRGRPPLGDGSGSGGRSGSICFQSVSERSSAMRGLHANAMAQTLLN